MLSRVLAIQRREAHYYEGLPILPRNVFYMWSLSNPAFNRLWDDWQAAYKEMRLVPSIDRKDILKGYTLDNMQWITHAENSSKLARRNTTTRCRGAAWYIRRGRDLPSSSIST